MRASELAVVTYARIIVDVERRGIFIGLASKWFIVFSRKMLISVERKRTAVVRLLIGGWRKWKMLNRRNFTSVGSLFFVI